MPTGVYPRKQEYRDAIRDGLRASKKKIGRPKGSQQSAEARRKISEAVGARVYTPEIKARMSAAAQKRQILHPSIGRRLGFRHTAETKKKMSETPRKEWSIEQREAHSMRMKGTATHTSVGQVRVMEKLTREGCRVLQRGWPDLLVVEPSGRIRAIEVKRPGGALSADQVAVFALLRSVGLEVEVVHESNKKEQPCVS